MHSWEFLNLLHSHTVTAQWVKYNPVLMLTVVRRAPLWMKLIGTGLFRLLIKIRSLSIPCSSVHSAWFSQLLSSAAAGQIQSDSKEEETKHMSFTFIFFQNSSILLKVSILLNLNKNKGTVEITPNFILDCVGSILFQEVL